jgi:hypothetical protein
MLLARSLSGTVKNGENFIKNSGFLEVNYGEIIKISLEKPGE